MHEPRREYARRLSLREESSAANDRRRFRVGMVRLAVFAGGVLIVYGGFMRALSAWWVLLPMAAFFLLGAHLTRLEEDGAALQRAQAFYRRGLARLDGRWAGAGTGGRRFLDDDHLYAGDLDLFGHGSLFELLCQARTRGGEETLAAWLREPAPADVVAERQESARELATMLDVREDVAVLAERARDGVHTQRLVAWGEREPMLSSVRRRWWVWPLTVAGVATIGVALVAIGALYAAANGDMRYELWFSVPVRAALVAALLVFGTVGWRFRGPAEAVFTAADQAANDVRLLAGVLQRLERERFTAPLLARLRADLDTDGQPPSQRINKLYRLMEFVYQRHNVMVRLLGPLLLWDVHLAHALEGWRAASGPGMRRWLNAVGQIEALSSIAAYHYERPANVFPEVVEPEEGPFIEATGIVHPFLAAGQAVANDVRLGGDGASVWVVSGSNMSGKSTLLRTLGVAVALAQAGAPVGATRLRLSPLRIGASIRVLDSLHEGESRFYAEILRLRAIVEASANEPPVLFLIDEFLHGTNSHDRRIGAAAIVRGLVERGALGLVTTHDLALTHIADELGERGANVHFEDHLEDGVMSFDYRLRPGVVEKSNALELMRSVGLDV